MELQANDENVRPSELNGPSDSDRARFGFKRRPRQPGSVEASPAKDMIMTASLSGKEVLTPKLTPSSGGACADRGPTLGGAPPPSLPGLEPVPALNLLELLDRELGDQDSAQAVLKFKPRAGRYDFKDQIEELRNVIRPLKDALAERLRREGTVREAMAKHQATVDAYVATLDARVAQSDKLISEKLAQERELNAQKVQKLRNQVLETERAWQQKELVQERAVAERDRETEELHRQALARIQGELQESKDDFQRQLQEASQLLQKQIEESRRLTQEMQETADQKEKALCAEWAAKLEEAAQQAKEREAQLRADCDEQLVELTARERQGRDAAAEALAALRDSAAAELAAAREARAAEVEALTQAHSAALERALAEAAGRESSASTRHHEEVARLLGELEEARAAHTKDLAELRSARQQDVQELTEKHAKAEAELRAALAKAQEEAEARERALRADREAAERLAQAEHGSLLQRLQAEHSSREQQLQADHSAQLARIQADCEAKVAEAEARAARRERDVSAELTAKLEHATSAAQQREQDLLAKLERQSKQAQETAADLQIQSEAAASAARSREEDLRSQLKAATFKAKQLADDLAARSERADAQEENLQQELLELGQRVRRLEGELATERSARDRESIAKATLQGEHTTLLKVADEQRASVQELQAQLTSSQERVAELTQELRGAEGEGERLREAVAEEQARLQKMQEELDSATATVSNLKSELSGASAELSTLRDRSKRLSVTKRELELEFSSYREHNSTSNAAQMQAITDLKVTVDKLTTKVDAAQMELGAKSSDIDQHQRCIRRLEEQLALAESSRRELHNTIQELRGNIRVFCRVRPGPPDAPGSLQQTEEGKLALTHGGETYNFGFDKVFGPSAAQEDLFSEVSGLVQSALDGYKVCIFAYGQTGSGKTYTMQGSTEPSTWGMIPRSLRQIFRASEDMRLKGWNWTLKASFMEVYNEVIRDLLRDETPSKANGSATPQCHTIKHDADWGTMVTNMTCVQVASLEHINSLMARAAKLRAVGSTDLNAQSSRSHSIFALYLSGSNAELNSELRGALHLVDLAGSERLDRSHAQGDRLKETQNINKSLSSLADVFLAKAENRSHVPFRNSKLTHLMEPCLSGQGKTLMAVNVGPEALNSHETLCSLRFASQVSQCTTGGKPKRSQKTLTKGPSSAALQTTAATRKGGC